MTDAGTGRAETDGHLPSKRTLALIVLGLALVLAGCSGSENPFGEGSPAANGNGNVGDGETIADGDGTDGAGDGGSTDWCREGESYSYANPQTGEQADMEIQGIVQRDGRQVCKASWSSNQGDVQRMEVFFSEDDSYASVVLYDGSGNVVGEFSGSDPGAGSGDGAGGGDGSVGGDDGGSSASYCVAGESTAFVDPQSGEQVSLEIQGIVSHEGNEVCKATWETNQGEIQRVEMYYTDDSSYRKVIMYDGDGNVVAEYGSSSG
jgi:hypothetical protein